MQAEPTLAPVQTSGGTSVPSAFIPSYQCASAFHFLLPEQTRNRRGGIFVISGETLQNRRRGIHWNSQAAATV